MHTRRAASSEWDRCEVKRRGWPSQPGGNQIYLQPPRLLSALPPEPLAGSMIHQPSGVPSPPPFLVVCPTTTSGRLGQEQF